MTTMQESLGSRLFMELDGNEYLMELYEKLLVNYSNFVFNRCSNIDPSINIDHCLRFADLLSKSSGTPYTEKHKTWSQEIISLLIALAPDDKKIHTFASSVLTSVGNFQGMNIIQGNTNNFPYLEKIFVELDKKTLKIPYQNDMYFFRPQKRMFDHLDDEAFSFSGPTSIGKSLLIRMFIKDKIANDTKKNFAILIPTKALINEISSAFIKELKPYLKEKNYRVVTSTGSILLQGEHNFVFVMTPERFLCLLIERPDIDISHLFIDEAHKISTQNERSAVYYKITDMLSKRAIKPQVIFASPNIPNPDIYLQLVSYHNGSSNSKQLQTLKTSYSPVTQLKFILECVDGDIKVLNNYTNRLIDLGFAHIVTDNDITDKLTQIITNLKTCNIGKQNLIYFSNKDNAINAAMNYAKTLPITSDKQLLDLAIEIENEIHPDYYLAKVLRKGVAYHVGYLPAAFREKIEKLFKDRKITHLFCTSTLLEGVNLPADNLIITSINNNGKMQPVEFKNLVGRVGRIAYNLYGNVFIVRYDQKQKTNDIENLLQSNVEDQILSIRNTLSIPQRKLIVEDLVNGNVQFRFSPKSQSDEKKAFVRKVGLMLLKDIIDDNFSLVRAEFEIYLNEQKLNSIKQHFGTNSTVKQDDDIFTSLDQSINLSKFIAEGWDYPQTNCEQKELVEFLEKLYDVFNWGIYEPKKGLGNKNHLSYYAVILKKWIKGCGLNMIIKDSIDFYKNNKEKFYINSNQVKFIPTSVYHKNIVITDVLSVIDRIILFKISNYFNRFSAEYKIQHNGESPKYDWYEYTEYGSTNKLNILLQRCGFSRDIAEFIKQQQRNYIVNTETGIRIKKSILNSTKKQAKLEAEDVMLNFPELFIE